MHWVWACHKFWIKEIVLVGAVLSYKLFSCELVSKGNDFELPVIAHEDVTNEEVIKFDFWVLYFFQEYFMIFDVVLDIGKSTI